MNYNAVIPEFIVSNLEQSRSFYCDLLGFSVEYEHTSVQRKNFSSSRLKTANLC